MIPVHLYDSRSKQLREVKMDENNKTYLYVCGPTGYNHAHIGNARPLMVVDTFRITLKACGYDVVYISNYTDVDDKINQAAKKENLTEEELTKKYIQAYQQLRQDLNVFAPDYTPKVTENMEAIIAFIEQLVKTDFAYVMDGDVYFRVNKIQEYGEISNRNIEDLKVGARIEENDKKELDENFAKLNRNLNEYFKYLQQKYLVDEILKIRSEELEKLEKQAKDKKKTKPESELIENEIKKKISEIEKSNQKVDKKIFKRNVEETILNRNQNILELKSLYLKLDSTSLKEKIVKEITNTSSLLDVLKFASYNYEFLAKSIIKKESDITDGEIQNKIKEIREFIKNTNFEVINNIGISDEKPVDLTIKDMYKLFGINLQKENFQEDNIEDIIKRVNIICGYNNIQNSPYTVENIEYILKAKALQK